MSGGSAAVKTIHQDKTFGVIAQALPQSLVPAVAFPVIAFGGYPALFLGGAAVGIIGAVLVTRIKGVK